MPKKMALTALDVGHSTRLNSQIPAEWTVDPIGSYDNIGADGFVANEPAAGQTLDDAFATLVASWRFDSMATFVDMTWSGH